MAYPDKPLYRSGRTRVLPAHDFEWASVVPAVGEWLPWSGIAGLAKLGEPEDQEGLRKMLKTGAIPRGRALAALALARLPSEINRDALAAAVRAEPGNPGVILAAGWIRAAQAAPDLRRLVIRGGTVDVRTVAALALGELNERSDTVLFRTLLQDPEPEVQAAAARALGQVRDPSAKPELAHMVALDQEAMGPAAVALAHLNGPDVFDLLTSRLQRAVKTSRCGEVRQYPNSVWLWGNSETPGRSHSCARSMAPRAWTQRCPRPPRPLWRGSTLTARRPPSW